MEQTEDKIKRLLETVFKATQIEALYFDRELNTVSCHYRKYVYEDLQRLSMNKIETFLLGIFKKNIYASQNFYTFFLNNNLVCNISVLHDGEICGAIVTQPVLLDARRSSEMDAWLSSYTLDPKEHDMYKRALQRAPVVAYDRIMPIGEVLHALSCSVFGGNGLHQILCGGDSDPALCQFIQSGMLLNRNHKPVVTDRHGGYPTYLKMKDSISKGDANALLEVINGISAGSVPMDQLASKNYIRSLKNSFIEVCAMCCFIAIEAGVNYTKTMDLSEAFIKQMENLENINDIYELMKSVLLAFTRSVAVTRITAYSKPVRLAIEYIENHYAEKITLGVLSRHVNLSESYLSNLIKKETGLSMADNINKVRIEQSKKILLTSSMNVAELASMVGYAYSNHFARMFKQFTGVTPSEFKKSICTEDKDKTEVSDMLRLISDQLHHTMSVFPGVVDVGRIVDPCLNLSWIQQSNGEIMHGTCYDFWNRKQSCEKCISRMALEQNKSFMKLEQKAGNIYFVLAAPVIVGNKKYVLELLKNVSENFFDCTGTITSICAN